ncbi:MAG: transcriptional repressor [Sphingobacteriales bacterium]|nr:MAG: transcriptional repressor [Sphingobacteriales bacterium]
MKRRNTQSKQIVLDILKGAGTALSQDSIEEQIGESMDRVTIYRVLNRFCEDGIAHRITSDEGKYYFAICNGCAEGKHKHNHIHFRCTHCSRVECIKGELPITLPEGYSTEHFNCFVSGRCRACA